MRRRRWHQGMLIAAGAYNLAWGAYACVDPQWLFRFAEMPPSNYPEIFACLGMVVGLYGLVYWEAARRPESSRVLVAVGLLGKILGPIGWLQLAVTGRWPPATFVLCLTNDVIWWVPFSLYLYDATIAARPSRKDG